MPTPHDKAFLADILEHPDDDTPRLVYADWLADHGDADRGDFIRTQVERARRDEDDPAQDELERREQQLLSRHPEWRREVPNRARANAVFRRGFLDGVQCNLGNLLRGAARLWQRFPICSLRLRSLRGELSRLCALPGVARLRELDLVEAPTAAEVAALLADGALPGLSILRVLYPAPRHFVEGLAGSSLLSRLQVLKLVAFLTNDREIRALADRDMPELRSLLLGATGGATLTAGTVTALLSPGRRPQLAEIDLSQFRLGEDAALALATSPGLGRLTRLRLAHNGIDAQGLAALLAGVGELRHLALDYNLLGAEGVELLAAAPHLAGLRRLSLHGVRLPEATLVALVRSPHLRNLRRLDLGNSGLGDAGAVALAEHLDLPELSWLGLAQNQIGDEGCECLARSLRLVALDLSGNRPGLRGVQALAASPHLARLASLNLAACGVGDDAALALANSPHLSGLWRLDLSNNPVREAGVAALLASPTLAGLAELALDRTMLPRDLTTALAERYG